VDCAYHPGTEAVTGCIRCQKLICEDCKTVIDGQIYCKPCAKEILATEETKETCKQTKGDTLATDSTIKTARKRKRWEELTRKEKILGSVGLIVIVGIVVGLLSVVFGLFGLLSESDSKPSPSDIGSTAILFVSESDEVPVCVDEEAFEELIKASVAKDDIGIAELLLLGKVFFVPNNTKVLVIDRDFAKRQIRILEGDKFGRTGWVPYEFLK